MNQERSAHFEEKRKFILFCTLFFNPNWQYFYCWILSLVLFCQYIYLETVYFGSKGICYGNVSIMVYWYFFGNYGTRKIRSILGYRFLTRYDYMRIFWYKTYYKNWKYCISQYTDFNNYYFCFLLLLSFLPCLIIVKNSILISHVVFLMNESKM